MNEKGRDIATAIMLSLLVHVWMFFVWPHLQSAAVSQLVVQGEMLPPVSDPPPAPVEPVPPQDSAPPPPPERTEVRRARPSPASDKPSSKATPDQGVALPVLAEHTDDASPDGDDYVVSDVPPLEPGEPIPFGSRPGNTPVNEYRPGQDSGGGSEGGVEGGTGGEDPVDHQDLAGFGQALRDGTANFKKYPVSAQRRSWQGLVKILVRFSRSGEAYQITVRDSSGHKVLDEAAREMVRNACAVTEMPAALRKKAFSVVVPVDFKLH